MGGRDGVGVLMALGLPQLSLPRRTPGSPGSAFLGLCSGLTLEVTLPVALPSQPFSTCEREQSQQAGRALGHHTE